MDVPEIDIAEAARRYALGVPVIDVREPHEYHEGHVPGAPLVPMSDVAEHVDDLPTDREILVICHSGGRSRRVAEYLRGRGIDAVNIAGGTAGWVEAGHPVATGEEPGA